MDKNTILGLIMIGVILIGFQYYSTSQSKKHFEKELISADSLFKLKEYEKAKTAYENAAKYNPAAPYPKQKLIEIAKIIEPKTEKPQQDTINKTAVNNPTTTNNSHTTTDINQTTQKNNVTSDNSDLFQQQNQKEKFTVLENNKIKVTFSNKGAKPFKVQLKEYKTYTQQDLYLLDGKDNSFTLNFYAHNQPVSTNDLYFKSMQEFDSIVVNEKEQSVAYRLYSDSDSYMEFVYSLKPDMYSLDYKINFVGMENIIANNANYIDLFWKNLAPAHERGRDWETQNTTVYYQFYKDQVDYLSERSDEKEEEFTTRVKWVAFKQQFFSSIIIADKYFDTGKVRYTKLEKEDDPEHLMEFYSEMSIPFNPLQDKSLGFKFYFGPNKYSTLKDYNTILGKESDKLATEQLVPLGWTLFRWINKLAIIPLFNFLGKFISNYGLIILIMTIIIKLVLFPFTYKSYVSSARMRVLKPEIDAINAKIPKDKAMER